ncbi:hypothetical protein QOZ80_5BG0434960 [Eleusine coracana subsp. coracana]|nr:hypothetical protein QOZ80_5BG0434960 [Eleusine coracana subsp. coracana]
MASSLAAFPSDGQLPRSRGRGLPAHALGSIPLLRLLAPRRRSRRFAAEFSTGGAGTVTGGSRARGGVDVAAVAAVLRDARTAEDVENSVKDFLGGCSGQGHLPLQVYTTVIRGLGREKRLDAALAVVEHLKRRGGGCVNQFVYNCLLGAVKNCGEIGRIEDILADMEAQGVTPNIVTLNTLMSIYVQQGKIDDVFKVYADIEERGLLPTAATYSTVMSAYKKAGNAFGAINFFVKLKEMCEKGELVGKNEDWEQEFVKYEKLAVRVCYMTMRQLLVSGQNPVGEVLKVLFAMDEAAVRPDRRDYERLVWACTREEHYTIAKELYQRIRELNGRDISLSVCNHLIWLMGKAKKWWAALQIYEDLLDKGPKSNTLSYELIMSHFIVLLNAAKKRGIWRWGVRLLNKMEEKGLKPGSKEWNTVLLACSRASEASAAVDIFKKMIDHGLKPDIVSYGALLSALEKGKIMAR